MASKLVGLFKTLTWADFGNPRPGAPPGPGQKATAAFTDADFQFTKGPAAAIVPGTPMKFRLDDNLEITVNFKSATSFVMKWVFDRPKQFQDDLLKHEQHHYDIAGLIARDLFIDLMQLKPNTYATKQLLQADIDKVRGEYKGKVQSINDLYDDETKSGREPVPQARWDGYFKEAFTKERVPKVMTPDGKAYKVRLLDVLRGAGLKP
jgi:hypothetical protein